MRRTHLGERPASRDELAAWYSAALEAQGASGLSVVAYATQLGVSVPTLYQWRRRLVAAERGKDAGARLVEVTSAPAATSVAEPGLVIRVNEGRRSIAVHSGFDDAELRRLIAVLESCQDPVKVVVHLVGLIAPEHRSPC